MIRPVIRGGHWDFLPHRVRETQPRPPSGRHGLRGTSAYAADSVRRGHPMGWRIPCQGPFSGPPVRTDSTTSWIARAMAAACSGFSTKEGWVAPETTRWRLLVDSLTDLFWSAIHPLELSSSAVRTISGFAPRLRRLPASASDRFATTNSSRKPAISFPVAAVLRASSRYVGGRSEKLVLAMMYPT